MTLHSVPSRLYGINKYLSLRSVDVSLFRNPVLFAVLGHGEDYVRPKFLGDLMDLHYGQGGALRGVYKEQWGCDGKQNLVLNREEAKVKERNGRS